MSEELKALHSLAEQMRWAEQDRKAEARRARFHPATGKLVPRPECRNRAIRNAALIREPIGRRGAEVWITYSPLRASTLALLEHYPEFAAISSSDPDSLNGYVAFPKRHAPRLPISTGHLVQYIPVHGGVTYATKDSIAAVWGFDTHHAGSENVPRTDPDWVKYQCHILYHGLEVAAKLWPRFRREQNQSKRAEMAQGLFDIDVAASGSLKDRIGFEALLSLLAGRIG
jgi:hypothetical protein